MIACCPFCGASSENARFCPSCGRPLEAVTATCLQPAAPLLASVPNTTLGMLGRSELSSRTGRFVPGTTLAARYRIVGLLGRGGMGEVYRADDLTLGQPVALKFLPLEISRDRERLERFRAEVSISRQVSHPNVCRVYDIGEVEGQVFLSMEYIDGEDLGTLLRRIGRLPQDKGLEIARQICAGLAAAHDRGIVHRDLKPGNVMIDGRGQARIADFGLASAASPDELVTAHHVAGTPAYMAPEQFEGKPASIASDIYALGLVLYEIFTGKRAFTGTTVGEFATLHRERTPSSMTTLVAELDPAIESAIACCLSKDPAARPSCALAVSAALPGGDPLAAALARGETPSPELVAAAGTTGLIQPARAIFVFLAALASIIACVIVAGYVHPIRLAPMTASPEVLIDRAKDIIRGFGYEEPRADSTSGFGLSTSLEQMRAEPWRARRDHLRAGQPPAFLYWYRQSPTPLATMQFGSSGRATPVQPAPIEPGMIEVDLDSEGRLHGFSAVPSQADRAGAARQDPNWALAFQKAQLDIAKFTPASATWVPPVYADARAAWDGVYPKRPDVKVHVEAAALHGRIVYFHEFAPWEHPATGQPVGGGEPWFQRLVAPLVALGLLAIALALAMRNLRTGRGDRRSALRLAIFLLVAGVLDGIFGADLHAQTGDFLRVVLLAIAQTSPMAGFAWLAYIALEPSVRRRWPQVLISWVRLVAGRWRDPLVGRDVLFGVTLGAALQTTAVLELFSHGTLNTIPVMWPLDGFRFAATWLLARLMEGVLLGLATLLLLFFLTLVLRRQWLAAALVVLLFAANNAAASTDPVITTIASAVIIAVIVASLLRFGLVTLVTTVFANKVLGGYPFTFDASSWYAPGSYMGVGVLVALAAFGTWMTADLRSLVPRLLGERD